MGHCSGDVTDNGSLHYVRSSATELSFQNRFGQFCGAGASGLTEPLPSTAGISGNVVSPGTRLVMTWGNNFSVFTADFDPTTLAGEYSYSWQAGYGDSDSRILNLNLTASTGTAYFGYGPEFTTSTSGVIDGFYCNWAGPGGHSKAQYAQKQTMTLAAGLWGPDVSTITYAPTNSCIYDGSGSFTYDRDLSGVIDGSDVAIVSALGLFNGGADVSLAITGDGYVPPTYP